MKRKFILLNLLFLWIMSYAQGYVGINNETPQATLDIKAPRNGAEVFRVSTIPDGVDHNKDFFFLAGEKETNSDAYNLRAMNTEDLFKLINIEIPSLRRIYITNKEEQKFRYTDREGIMIPLKKLISNSAPDLYKFYEKDGYVEILETGYYEVSAWVGVASIETAEGDILLSIAKKGSDDSIFQNFKRMIITRSDNGYTYKASNGVGSSFAFVEKLKKGDKIIPQINPIRFAPRYREDPPKVPRDPEVHPSVTEDLRTIVGSVSMAITRVDSKIIP